MSALRIIRLNTVSSTKVSSYMSWWKFLVCVVLNWCVHTRCPAVHVVGVEKEGSYEESYDSTFAFGVSSSRWLLLSHPASGLETYCRLDRQFVAICNLLPQNFKTMRLFTELCHLGPFLGPFSKERLRKWKWVMGPFKSEINKTLHERRWWPPPPHRHHLHYFETSHFLYQKEIPHFGWIVSIQQFLSRRNILDL